MGLLFFSATLLGQSTSTEQNPTVVFTSPGTKEVTLEACNAEGCGTLTRSVVVLDPMPRIVGVGSVPARVLAGQGISLAAESTGRPPLTHRWQITGLTGNLTLTGNPALWNTASPGVGLYLLQLEVLNSDGSVFSSPVSVNVVPPAIFADGFESGSANAWQAQQ